MPQNPVTTYIQGHDTSTLSSHQSRTAAKQAGYLIPRITPSSVICDVGCGPGTITCDFAQLASSGKVIGVDYSDTALSTARTEASNRNLTNITFQSASAFELPFDNDTFDIVHCHALLVHLPNAQNALKEMRRVCKARGIVAAREPDWSTLVIHPYSAQLEHWKNVQASLNRHEGSEPNAGRYLSEWALAAGFSIDQIDVTSDVLQYSGKEEVKWWGELFAQRMKTEMARRMLEAGLASEDEINGFRRAYLEWSTTGEKGGIWAMMHMRLLARKG